MIQEIIVTPPVATYENPSSLNDLRAINFIFGSNGTGKTTISRVIAAEQGHEHCQLVWQGGSKLERMVYNRDFVDRNFNKYGPLQGVFSLGEDQVEAENKINELRPVIEKATQSIASLNTQLDGADEQLGKCQQLAALESTLREKCWKQKQRHDDYFQVAFSGVRNNAENFKAKVLVEQTTNTAQLLALDELKEKAKTVFANDLERVAPLEKLSAANLLSIEANALLQKVIVGNQDVDIAALINRLGNSDWVKQGRQYHEQEPEICPFCQQPTEKKFEDDLKDFFNETYDNDVQSLRQLQASYRVEGEQLLATIQRCVEARNPFLNQDQFEAVAHALKERLKLNLNIFTQKVDEPSSKVELESINQLVDQLQSLLVEANEATNEHNQIVRNIASEKDILIGQVWRFVLNELSDDLRRHQESKDQLKRAIQGLEQSLRQKNLLLHELQDQVKELEKQTTSIQPTIAAINDLLRKFGFSSFSIEESDQGRHYRIKRANGEDASHSLSEGEKTFITFLYFYYLIKGAQSPSGITANRVVVFDDPISSLDSDVLYIVSSLIKGVMEEVRGRNSQIKQVFVLTHNVYFHKEVSFNKSRSTDNALRDESFWMVKKLDRGSVVERCPTNPIRSAYELLWADVKAQNVSSVGLQNTLRRILENYFSMWGGMGKDEICALFDGRDKLICQSLFSWVNDGSHSIHDDLYINHGEQTNEAYLRVFRHVFEKAGQLGHYIMMMSIEHTA